jgi:hypothetical protein
MIQTDLLHLKAFVAVAREGTVSRAAEQLHLSQPAVSLQLKGLQERIWAGAGANPRRRFIAHSGRKSLERGG